MRVRVRVMVGVRMRVRVRVRVKVRGKSARAVRVLGGGAVVGVVEQRLHDLRQAAL